MKFNEFGFSLIEMMVGLGVLSILSTAIISQSLSVTRGNQRVEFRQKAIGLSRQVNGILESSQHCTASFYKKKIDVNPSHYTYGTSMTYGKPDSSQPSGFAPMAGQTINFVNSTTITPAFLATQNKPILADLFYRVVDGTPIRTGPDAYLGEFTYRILSPVNGNEIVPSPTRVVFEVNGAGEIEKCLGIDGGLSLAMVPAPTGGGGGAVVAQPASNPIQQFIKSAACEVNSGGMQTYDPSTGACKPLYVEKVFQGSWNQASCPGGRQPALANTSASDFNGSTAWKVCGQANWGGLQSSVATQTETNINGVTYEPAIRKFIPEYKNGSCHCHYATEITNPQVGVCTIKCFDPTAPLPN